MKFYVVDLEEQKHYLPEHIECVEDLKLYYHDQDIKVLGSTITYAPECIRPEKPPIEGHLTLLGIILGILCLIVEKNMGFAFTLFLNGMIGNVASEIHKRYIFEKTKNELHQFCDWVALNN